MFWLYQNPSASFFRIHVPAICNTRYLRGKEFFFPAIRLKVGCIDKIQVIVYVHGQDIFFEHDEERNFRAVIDSEELGNSIKHGMPGLERQKTFEKKEH